MISHLDKTKLVLVEGKDECNVVGVILKEMLGEDYKSIVCIKDMGGSTQFNSKLPVYVKTSGFTDNVRVIAIIRDAEGCCASTFESIRGVLNKVGLDCPDEMGKYSDSCPKVGIYIMPDNCNSGMLEDLFLKSYSEHPIMTCVEAYIKCIISKSDQGLGNISKTKSQVFLAGMNDPARNLGEAACKGHWNFEHESLGDFIAFIQEFISLEV